MIITLIMIIMVTLMRRMKLLKSCLVWSLNLQTVQLLKILKKINFLNKKINN